MPLLFKPSDLAGTQPPNRVVMAPMTRARALADDLRLTKDRAAICRHLRRRLAAINEARR
jgi:2,4-dienoyl-CoA reductase-like NADH-dependent reductase (Old Yellow Enzyme family)